MTGSGLITLAATLAAFGNIQVAGMVLLLGVDRLMSEARAITNHRQRGGYDGDRSGSARWIHSDPIKHVGRINAA